MLTAMETATTLQAFNAAADRSLVGATEALQPAEARRLADIVSVAKASARLWAPVSEGGEGGRGITPPPGEAQAVKTDWGDVVAADIVGCLVGLETGCVAAAIIASALEYYQQNNLILRDPNGGAVTDDGPTQGSDVAPRTRS